MTYTVKEIFYTLQGEGHHSGRAAVFCRFAGCNLWSGREQDRATAICRFCDTDFVGGERYADAAALTEAIAATWQGAGGTPYVVFTGGEPLLQLDTALIEAMHTAGFEIGVETNGTIPAPAGIDWLCVSPKAGAPLLQHTADELKLVFPQPTLMPADLSTFQAPRRLVSPMDGADLTKNTAQAAAYCLANPEWRLNIQAHKAWGIR